jgi:hypothetical protein
MIYPIIKKYIDKGTTKGSSNMNSHPLGQYPRSAMISSGPRSRPNDTAWDSEEHIVVSSDQKMASSEDGSAKGVEISSDRRTSGARQGGQSGRHIVVTTEVTVQESAAKHDDRMRNIDHF